MAKTNLKDMPVEVRSSGKEPQNNFFAAFLEYVKQHADEAFQAADDCAVEHHRSGSAVAFGHIFGTEASRHLEVDLDRTALPTAA